MDWVDVMFFLFLVAVVANLTAKDDWFRYQTALAGAVFSASSAIFILMRADHSGLVVWLGSTLVWASSAHSSLRDAEEKERARK